MQEYLKCLDKTIADMRDKLKSRPHLGDMFAQCFVNTLETTVRFLPDGTVFVITGDIEAMWLRDSAAQVKPYLRLAKQPLVGDLIKKVIDKQIAYINIDPYANAFNQEPSGRHYAQDKTAIGPWAWERKYELDSLCYPLELAWLFWKKSDRTDHFDSFFRYTLDTILDLFIREQHHEEESAYRFERHTLKRSETLQNDGLGTPVAYTGMIWSGFRPSDDACEYGYLVPANLFAARILDNVSEIADEVYKDAALKARAEILAGQVREGIEKFGIIEHPVYGRIYAYETDGLGNHLLMDDAGMPSLLSLPYLNCCDARDTVYQNSRRYALSKENPFYFEGSRLKGIGSPHTKDGYVWPMGVIMQGITAATREEALACIEMLAATDDGTGYMHEGIDSNNPSVYTRPWFAWANSAFSEFLLDFTEKYSGSF